MDEDEDKGPHGSPGDRKGACGALCGASGRGGISVRTGYGVAEGIRGDVPL